MCCRLVRDVTGEESGIQVLLADGEDPALVGDEPVMMRSQFHGEGEGAVFRVHPVARFPVALVDDAVPGVPVLVLVEQRHLFPHHHEGTVVIRIQIVIGPRVEDEVPVAVEMEGHGEVCIVAQGGHGLRFGFGEGCRATVGIGRGVVGGSLFVVPPHVCMVAVQIHPVPAVDPSVPVVIPDVLAPPCPVAVAVVLGP